MRSCILVIFRYNSFVSQWSKYDECSELCGGGDQERTRTCTNPKPKHGGKDCVGAESQTRACNTQKCKSKFPFILLGMIFASSFSSCL